MDATDPHAAPTAAPARALGRVAGRYELRSLLRGDGAVRVYAASDRGHGGDVRLCVVDEALVQDDVWTAFAHLVKTMAAANPPGLALPPHLSYLRPTPLHFVLDEERSLLGLDRVLERQGPLPWRRALDLGRCLADILHGAQAAGGAGHRALTPARCAVDGDGRVRILDYGLAMFEPVEPPRVGDPYRAPEQEHGAGDVRSDVYALSAIVFELITGKRHAARSRPCLRAFVPKAPQVLEDLLVKAMDRDPGRRARRPRRLAGRDGGVAGTARPLRPTPRDGRRRRARPRS